MRRTSRGTSTTLAAILAAILPACGKSEPPPAPPTYAQESWFSDGPLELHAAIDDIEIDVVGAITLHFDALIQPGYILVTPEINEKLGVFDVVEIKRTGPTMTATGIVSWSLDVTIEPYLPGEYEIPPLDFAYTPVADSPENGFGGMLTTRPILVTVLSVLESDELSLGELRDVIDPTSDFVFPVAGVVIAGFIGLGLLAAIIVIARKLQLEPPPPSPVTEALQRLRILALRTHDDPGEREGTLGEVSQLIRRCIAHRGESGAARMSERELRRSMASCPGLDTHEHIRLSSLFKRLDEAQFAGFVADRQETSDIVQEAIELLPAIERAFVQFSIADGPDDPLEEAISPT